MSARKLVGVILVLVGGLCATVAGVASAAGPVLQAPGLDVAVSFAPDKSAADAVVCTARIVDLQSGALLASPRIALKKGTTGRATVGSLPDWKLDVEASIDTAGAKADYTVTYTKGGKVVGVQKATLQLR